MLPLDQARVVADRLERVLAPTSSRLWSPEGSGQFRCAVLQRLHLRRELLIGGDAPLLYLGCKVIDPSQALADWGEQCVDPLLPKFEIANGFFLQSAEGRGRELQEVIFGVP